MTSFEDCRRELLDRGGLTAQAVYAGWKKRAGYESVHDFVHNFEHSYLQEITHEEVKDVCQRSEHALGDVRAEEKLREVEDWTTPFAFEHLFHKYLEDQHQVPTWQEFRVWLNGDAAEFFTTPLLRDTDWANADSERRKKLKRAYQWRIGKFYYSAMKELDLYTRLRHQYNLPIRYHLLADVLLRVDFWMKDDIICVYFPNREFRAGQEGRKPPASRFLGKADPEFRIHHVAIERQGFGKFWMASDRSVEHLADILTS